MTKIGYMKNPYSEIEREGLKPMLNSEKETVLKVNIDYYDNVEEVLKYFNQTGILLTEKDKHEVL